MNKKEKNKTSNSKINIFFKTIVFFLAAYLMWLIAGKLESIILKEPLKFSKINSNFIFFMAFYMPLSWLLNYSKKEGTGTYGEYDYKNGQLVFITEDTNQTNT